MDRRAFLGTLGLLAAPHAAEAQPAGKVHRIGILTLGPAGSHPSVWWQPFIDGLRELNYVEGHTLAIAYAGADANPDRLPELAVGLVKAKVDLIVTPTTPTRAPGGTSNETPCRTGRSSP